MLAAQGSLGAVSWTLWLEQQVANEVNSHASVSNGIMTNTFLAEEVTPEPRAVVAVEMLHLHDGQWAREGKKQLVTCAVTHPGRG